MIAKTDIFERVAAEIHMLERQLEEAKWARDDAKEARDEAYERAAQQADGIMCFCGARNVGELIARRIRALANGGIQK